MKEIPMTLVKGNQLMMATLTLLSIILQSTWLVGITLLLILLSLIFGPKANIAFIVTNALIKKDLGNDATESAVLTRFNQSIAASLLTVALVLLLTSGHWLSWVFVGMVTIAATIAILGFCVGCFLYFQLKQISYKMKTKKSN
ncbi:DUF4395 domain-containing protein [Evansella sp. AB-P1]|uniref:DUF4395 domain-containing protein n=1 Tax=Evansella sp. AB-P1 TaxID=3037653 RepID=UPI00241FB99E|nr:DUF4395 domain-containing protein [Evansella sp. AB-P1]MDG5789689.1 DUF4395 domain-containing protein [Evansella sp. AB-P1]